MASREGHESVVKMLLERGADIHQKDNNGKFILYIYIYIYLFIYVCNIFSSFYQNKYMYYLLHPRDC